MNQFLQHFKRVFSPDVFGQGFATLVAGGRLRQLPHPPFLHHAAPVGLGAVVGLYRGHYHRAPCSQGCMHRAAAAVADHRTGASEEPIMGHFTVEESHLF